MTGRSSGAPPGGTQGPTTTSFSERYAPPKPPRWRRILSVETAQSVLTFLVAVALIVVIGYLTWTSIERSGQLADPPERSSGKAAASPPSGSKAIALTSADGTKLSALSTPSKAKKTSTAVILVHDAGGERADLARLALGGGLMLVAAALAARRGR